jgi:uncharacterized membrane protein YedE/YeeE
MDKSLAQRRNENGRKAGVLLVGGMIGALVGVGAAYLLWQAREKRSRGRESEEPLISSGGAVKLGVLLFGLLRQINDIARGI